MKEEIKEILKEWKQFLSWCYKNNDKTVELHRDNVKLIIDYITNLQAKVKLLTTGLEATDKAYKDYKLRNEKAIEYIKPKFIEQGGLTSYEVNDLLNDLLNKLQGEDTKESEVN